MLCLGLLTACRLDMRDQPRYEPYEESTFFADRSAVRAAVPGTVARGQLYADSHLYRGEIGGKLATTFPFTVTQQVLERGEERYDIFCTPCHGLVGDGEGIVTEYGMRKPPSFHDPDLRDQPAGYYFLLISEGTRVMPGYAARIPAEDRWAIVAYIRALQLSQNADVTQLPADELPKLEQTDVITQ
jgi:mono/diheme cytochrome c family protein